MARIVAPAWIARCGLRGPPTPAPAGAPDQAPAITCAQAAAKSAGGSASKASGAPSAGWRSASAKACSACRCMPSARGTTVQPVGQQRVAEVRQVHSDLVRAAGVQRALQRADARAHPQAAHIGACRLAAGAHRHAQPGRRVAADRCVDRLLGRRHCAVGQCAVAPLHLARGDRPHQRRDRRRRLAHDHQAGGVLVEPVHDAGARQRRGAGMVREQPVEQRARPVARGRVHHQSGGLVEHQQVLVLVDDRQRHRLRREGPALGGRHQFEFDLLAGAQAARGHGAGLAVDAHMAVAHQRLQPAARELRRQRDQQLVQPPAVRGGIDGDAAPLAARSAGFVGRRRLGVTPVGGGRAGLGWCFPILRHLRIVRRPPQAPSGPTAP